MKRWLMPLAVATGSAPGIAVDHARAPAPILRGQCAITTIRWLGQRLGDGSGRPIVPSPGSAVTLADGVRGVSYDDIPAILSSRVGDRVRTCLVRLPTHCPPGDSRGKRYTTTNLRTGKAWTLPDAEHECGGA